MAGTISMSTKFPAELTEEVIDLVRGKSAFARLSQQIPVAFTGTDIWTFDMDGEASLVAENGAKINGGATAGPVNVKPLKLEYGVRVSKEFMTASEERKVEILRPFNEGFARKVARALDMMAIAKVNPRDGQASALIDNDFTEVTNKVLYTPGNADAAINDAAALIGDFSMTGIALSKTLGSAMGNETNTAGAYKYPELRWGASPEVLNGIRCEVNGTINKYGTALGIVGDFEAAFKWGYAKDIELEVIPYGDPDNTGSDLAGHNQVYLRAEAFIGFAMLTKDAFARIETPYAIKYDGNNATSGTTADTVGMAGQAVEVAANGFTKTGKTFSGWNTKADGSGTAYAAGASYTLTAAGLTLYAQWS
ncbi:MAG: InlB B-repeat-containing protein [Lachnospiraceae bacterium]|nr:InlB B-repeat-containing protein [Lachnospiraceae bacterium]